MTISLEPPLQHELRFLLLGRNQTNNVFIQPLRNSFLFDGCDKAPLIIAFRKIADAINVRAHCILPGTRLTCTSFPWVPWIAVNRMGRIKSESISFCNAPRTTWLMILW